MADFQTCYNFMLPNEDSVPPYEAKPDYPRGSFAISGINSFKFPAQYAAIAAIPQTQRGEAIMQFYKTEFWNQWFEQMTSNEIAKRVFDASINFGLSPAVTLLQQAINLIHTPPIVVDGQIGPDTIETTNACSDVLLVPEFKKVRVDYYKDLVSKNPQYEKYIDGWIARANR